MKLKNLSELVEIGKACIERPICGDCPYKFDDPRCFYSGNNTESIVKYLEMLLNNTTEKKGE